MMRRQKIELNSLTNVIIIETHDFVICIRNRSLGIWVSLKMK